MTLTNSNFASCVVILYSIQSYCRYIVLRSNSCTVCASAKERKQLYNYIIATLRTGLLGSIIKTCNLRAYSAVLMCCAVDVLVAPVIVVSHSMWAVYHDIEMKEGAVSSSSSVVSATASAQLLKLLPLSL